MEEEFEEGWKMKEAIFALWRSAPAWLKWLVFTAVVSAGAYVFGTCNGERAGCAKCHKKGFLEGVESCPKPTKTPEAVEKWRKKK